jgi:hypothetical protein
MEAATVSPTAKSEFINDSAGTCGITVLENGEPKAIALKPGKRILLSAQEQILTANAPQEDKDNPFTNGTLRLVTPAKDIANRRAIGDPSLIASAEQAADAEAAEAERIAREEAARQKAEAEAKRTAEAQKQAERGAQPRKAPSAKSEGEGATPVAAKPDADETAVKPEAAKATGKAAPAEEVGTPEAKS